MNSIRKHYSQVRICLLVILFVPLLAQARQTPPSQIQVARRFMLAVVQGEWEAAYAWLTPEAQQRVSRKQFKTAVRPFQEQAGQYGAVIDLYKLGYRLRDADIPQPFVAFSFRADTLRKLPHFQLDVTFQDSTTRQVQGFRLVPLVAN